MRHRRLGVGALALTLGVLAAYAVLHSPLRPWVDDLLVGECTFFCRLPSATGAIAGSAAALWLLLVCALAAWSVAARSVPAGLERPVAWGLVAFGLIVIPGALLAFLGDLVGVRVLRPPLGPLLASIPGLVALGWSWRAGWRPAIPPAIPLPRLTPLVAFLLLLAVLTWALRLGVAITHPATGFDDLGYHGPLAVLLWRDGSLSSFLDRIADTPVLSHPGGAELFQGLLLLVGGEPLALMGQLPSSLLGAAGIGLFAVRLGLRRGAGLLAALLFLLSPMVLEQSGHLRNDLAGAALLIAVAGLLAAPRATWLLGPAPCSTRATSTAT